MMSRALCHWAPRETLSQMQVSYVFADMARSDWCWVSESSSLLVQLACTTPSIIDFRCFVPCIASSGNVTVLCRAEDVPREVIFGDGTLFNTKIWDYSLDIGQRDRQEVMLSLLSSADFNFSEILWKRGHLAHSLKTYKRVEFDSIEANGRFKSTNLINLEVVAQETQVNPMCKCILVVFQYWAKSNKLQVFNESIYQAQGKYFIIQNG